jgi:hypothetical protein
MLTELGRRGDVALTRGVDAAHDAVHATVLHLRRIVGAVTVALGRVTRETQDLVWDYQDVASDLRRRGDSEEPQIHRPALRVVHSEV